MAVKKRRRVARKSRRPEPKAKPAHSGMDRNFENFVEEIAERGRRAGHHKERAKDWWYSTFGAIGPLLGAAVCMVFVAIVAWVLLAANTEIGRAHV